jgi:hypothetical protein
MPSLRLRGQETSIIITRGGVVEATLDNIHEFNAELSSEILEASYLGQKTKLHDDIFNGCKGDFAFHTHSEDWLVFAAALIDRQKRNTPDLVINITTVLFYPDGDNPQIFFPDCKFGPMGISLANREAYVGNKITWASDDFDVAL